MRLTCGVSVALLVGIAGAIALPGSVPAAPGDPDRSFGTNGYLALDQHSSDGREVVVFPDGRSVTMTSFSGQSNDDDAILRLWSRLRDGRVDTRWGEDGMVEIERRSTLYPQSLERVRGGGVVVGADMRTTGPDKSMLFRLRRDGSRDKTFSRDGLATFGTNNHVELCGEVAVRGNGSITAGFLKRNGGVTYSLVRLTPDGEHDRRFGNEGVVELDPDSSCGDSRTGPDGTTVMAAYRYDGQPGRYTCIFRRFTRTGAPDPSFSEDGRLEVSQGVCQVHTVSATGAVVVAEQVFEDDRFGFEVQRIAPDGELDPDFGRAGTARVAFGGADYLRGVEIGPRNRIYLGGSTSSEDFGFEVAVARLTPKGELDSRFRGTAR